MASPYGIYDVLKREGFVNVGIDHDIATFAVESTRGWWKDDGKKSYSTYGEYCAILRTFHSYDIVANNMSADYKEIQRRLTDEEAVRYAIGIRLVGKFVDSLAGAKLLPNRFARVPKVSTTPTDSGKAQLPLALQPRPFEIKIPIVSKEVYQATRQAVETAIPNVFIASIRSVTMETLLLEDRQRQERSEPKRLWLVRHSKSMRATFPPSMEVFIDPSNFRIEGSNFLSTDDQIAAIARVEASYKKRLPEELRSYVGWHMVDPSTLSQLEDAWMDAGYGFLLPNFYARTDVRTVGAHVADIGRLDLDDDQKRRDVFGYDRDDGDEHIFAVAVGVLPQKEEGLNSFR